MRLPTLYYILTYTHIKTKKYKKPGGAVSSTALFLSLAATLSASAFCKDNELVVINLAAIRCDGSAFVFVQIDDIEIGEQLLYLRFSESADKWSLGPAVPVTE